MIPVNPQDFTSDPDEQAALTEIAEIAHDAAGLCFPPAKTDMLRARLARRLTSLGMTDYRSYLAHLTSLQGDGEKPLLVSALTTNVSQFFRGPHHFDQLRSSILPALLTAAAAGRRVRLWSAGCASGQEAYSLAMTILDLVPQAGDLDIRILATDVDESVIARARQGLFPADDTSQILQPARLRYTHDRGTHFSIAQPARALIRFHRHNLHGPWPMRCGFDVIFCRNVLIYFDPAAQSRLLARFASALTTCGWLFLGHSERVTGPARQLLIPAGPTSYRHTDVTKGAA